MQSESESTSRDGERQGAAIVGVRDLVCRAWSAGSEEPHSPCVICNAVATQVRTFFVPAFMCAHTMLLPNGASRCSAAAG